MRTISAEVARGVVHTSELAEALENVRNTAQAVFKDNRVYLEQFIRDARFPAYLGHKLRQQFPQLSERDTDLVMHGLRQFFMAHLRSQRKFVAMPSQVADDAWHEFILHTRGYEQWCHAAFGSLLHHSPAEVLGRDPKRNSGLRRAWFWACKEESIDPRAPTRLPLLFALDKKFAIAGGFTYVPNCRDIDNKAGSPWLGGQSAVYIKAQLQAFAAGTRRNDISQQMRNIARAMTAKEIDEAAAYYASQPPDIVKAVD